MKDVGELSDAEIREELSMYGVNVGPVTGTTRLLYEKKLAKLRKTGTLDTSKAVVTKSPVKKVSKSPSRSTTTKSVAKKSVNRSENEEGSDSEEIVSPRASRTVVATKPVVSTPKKDRTPSPTLLPPLPSSRRRNLNTSASSRAGGDIIPGLRTTITLPDDSSPKSRNSRPVTPPRKMVAKSLGDRPGGTPPRKAPTPWIGRQGLDESLSSIRSRNLLDVGNTTAEESDGEPAESSRVFHSARRTAPSSKAWSVLGRNTETMPSSRRDVKRKAAVIRRDVSTVLMIVLSVFFLLLAIAYVATARTEAVVGTVNVLASSTRDTISFFYNYAVLPVALVAGAALVVVALFFLYKRYQDNQGKEEEEFQILVEKIMDHVRESAEEGDEFISVPHVRDIIYPPAKRTKSQLARWERAVEFLDSSESRMSTETRVLRGQECAVWRWLPYKKTGWQGNALQTPSSPLSPSSVPAYALTRSLKIREVFQNTAGEAVDFGQIRRDILEKVYPVRPLHLGFGTESPEGLVFMKLSSLEDAKEAFSALHSSWYNGRLLRVKYIRDSRYEERFPQSPSL